MAAPDVRFRRLAEQVADELRRRILSGELADGSVLPTEDELLVEFRKRFPDFALPDDLR